MTQNDPTAAELTYGEEALGYENPARRYAIGDLVRVGSGSVEWKVVGRGATTGLTLRNGKNRERTACAFNVTLIRSAEDGA